MRSCVRETVCVCVCGCDRLCSACLCCCWLWRVAWWCDPVCGRSPSIREATDTRPSLAPSTNARTAAVTTDHTCQQ